MTELIKMRTGIIKTSVITAFLIISAGFSSAQVRDDFLRELRRFDRQFEQVMAIVQSFDNARGMQLLGEAEALRSSAEAAFNNRDFVLAKQRLTMAFAKLEAAAKITLDGPIKRLWSQVEALLQRAEQEVLGRNNKEAERLLREAKENFEAAKRARNMGDVRKVVEHLRVAKTLAERSLDMVHTLRDRIEQDRHKFEILRERAREAVEKVDDERPRQIFQQALKLANSAEEAYHSGNLSLARKFLNQASLLLLRAIDLATGSVPDPIDRIDILLSQLQDEIDEARSSVSESGIVRARVLFNRAERAAAEAEIASNAGKHREAIIKIELAQNMLDRALRLARNRDDSPISDRLLNEIENTRHDITSLRQEMPSDSPADALSLLNMADVILSRAERAAQAGLNRVALGSVLVSQNLLSRAEKLMSRSGPSDISKSTIQARFEQLDAAIQEAETELNETPESWNLKLLESASEIRNLSYESFLKGNYEAANQGIQVAFDLVRKSMK